MRRQCVPNCGCLSLSIPVEVDQLDSTVDFARAYGTLGWALSKVIQRKDAPALCDCRVALSVFPSVVTRAPCASRRSQMA